MWRGAALLALVVGGLTACSTAPSLDHGAIRDPKVLMSATSRYDAARFAGHWVTRADYAGDWRVAGFDFTAPTTAQAGAWREQAANGGPARVAQVTPDQSAVFTLNYGGVPSQSRQMVVLWVDEGFRTAVLSTRDGSYAFIADRKASGGADRVIAARQMLEHNGFDATQLRGALE